MKKRLSIGFVSIAVAMAIGSYASFAAGTAPSPQGLVQVQYDRYQDNRDQRGFDDRDRDRDFRGGPLWRPGQILPGPLMNRVVYDWEERGLLRPPGGHQWVRVGFQFILVRGRDRMIARILNFN